MAASSGHFLTYPSMHLQPVDVEQRKGVVYILTCARCGSFYIGETSSTLRKTIKDTMRKIRYGTCSEELNQHFQHFQNGHFVNENSFQLLMWQPDTEKRVQFKRERIEENKRLEQIPGFIGSHILNTYSYDVRDVDLERMVYQEFHQALYKALETQISQVQMAKGGIPYTIHFQPLEKLQGVVYMLIYPCGLSYIGETSGNMQSATDEMMRKIQSVTGSEKFKRHLHLHDTEKAIFKPLEWQPDTDKRIQLKRQYIFKHNTVDEGLNKKMPDHRDVEEERWKYQKFKQELFKVRENYQPPL